MPPKEGDPIQPGSLYVIINGEYKKVGSIEPYEISETTTSMCIKPRKYSLYVRIKILLHFTRCWISRRVHHNQWTIEWFERPTPTESVATITKHNRKCEKRRNK